MAYFMGIDLGTSSAKAIVCDEKGEMYGIGQAGYDVLSPEPGFYEQDPETWWQCTVKAVRQALAASGVDPALIRGIGFSAQMHGGPCLDSEKRLLRPAIIHLDQRSVKERELIMEKAGTVMRESLMNRPASGMMICSLVWMKEHEPRIYDKIRYVLMPKDYIRFRLTGEINTDYSDASASLAFSLRDNCWCEELLDLLDIKKDIWPPVLPSWQEAGRVTPEAARETGLCPGTMTVAGSGDCFAAAVANGIVDEGVMACNIGTSSQLAVVVKKPVTDPEMVMQLWCHSVENTWFYQGGCLNGGSALNWLRNKMLRTELSYAQLDLLAGEVPAGSEDLMFLPYLTGERTPFNHPQARGIYAGLTLRHDMRHMVRATMEGILFNMMECRQYFTQLNLSQKKVIASGGAARGVTWKQIEADMLDMPIYTTRTKEEACFGAALYAAVAAGVYPDVRTAGRETVQFNPQVVEPIPANAALYRERQQVFHDLYYAVKGFYQ